MMMMRIIGTRKVEVVARVKTRKGRSGRLKLSMVRVGPRAPSRNNNKGGLGREGGRSKSSAFFFNVYRSELSQPKSLSVVRPCCLVCGRLVLLICRYFCWWIKKLAPSKASKNTVSFSFFPLQPFWTLRLDRTFPTSFRYLTRHLSDTLIFSSDISVVIVFSLQSPSFLWQSFCDSFAEKYLVKFCFKELGYLQL